MPTTREAYQSLYGDDAEEVASDRGADLGDDDSGDSSSPDRDDGGSSRNSSNDGDSGRAARLLDGSAGGTSGPDTPASDPDTGDTTTRRMRDDAESDPMNPQTEPTDIDTDDGGSGGSFSTNPRPDDTEEVFDGESSGGSTSSSSGGSSGGSSAESSSSNDSFSTSPRPDDTEEVFDGGSSSGGTSNDSSSGSSSNGPEENAGDGRVTPETGSDRKLQNMADDAEEESESPPVGNTPSSPSAPVQAPDDGGRDPADIEPGPASQPDPTPEQGLEENSIGGAKERAQEIEDEVITNLEEEVGREFSDEDVRINRVERDGEPDLFQPELTSTGQEQVDREQFQREFEAIQEVERQVQQRSDRQLTRGDDYEIESTQVDGETQFSVDLNTGPRNTDVSPSLATGTGNQSRSSENSSEGTQQNGDVFSGAVSAAEQTLNVDVPGDGSLVEEGSRAVSESSEQFGDVELRIPEGSGDVARTVLAPAGPVGQSLGSVVQANEGRRSEDVAREASDAFQSEVVDPAASAAGDFAASEAGDTFSEVAGSPGGQAALAPLGPVGTSIAAVQQSTDAADPTPSQRRALAEGSAQGLGDVADVAGTAVLAKEGAEVAIEGVEQAAQGRGTEYAGEVAAAGAFLGAQTAQYARNNPEQFTGQLVGGAVAGSSAESAVRSGLRAGSRTTPSVDTGQTATSGSSTTSRLLDRAPNVEVDVGRNVASGRVDVNVRSDITRRIDQEINRVRNFPERASQRARQAAVDAQNLRQDVGIRARQQATLSAAEAESGLLRTAVRTRNAAADLTDNVGRSTARGATRAMNARQDAGLNLRQQAALTAAEADSALLGSAVRARNAAADAPEGISQSLRQSLVDAQNARQDFGLRARQQATLTAAEADASIVGGAVRARNAAADATDSIDRAFRRGGVRAMNARQDAGIAARQQLAFSSAQTERSLLGGAVDAQNLRQDLGGPIIRERSTFMADQSGRGVSPVDAASPALDAADRVRSGLSDLGGTLGDLGVRVDVGRPTSRTVNADDLEVDGEVGVAFDGDFGDTRPRGDDQVEIFEVDADETGDGTVALRQTDSRELDSPQPEIELSRRNDGAGLVGGVAGAAAGGLAGADDGLTGLGPSAGFDSELASDTGLGTDLGVGPTTGVDTGPVMGSTFETGPRTRGRGDADTTTRTDTELAQSPIAVGRAEQRAELASGVDTGGRRRRGLPGLEGDNGPSDDLGGGADGFVRREERDLLNPITGR